MSLIRVGMCVVKNAMVRARHCSTGRSRASREERIPSDLFCTGMCDEELFGVSPYCSALNDDVV